MLNHNGLQKDNWRLSEMELLPCPFCGGEAEIKRKGTMKKSMQIECTFCGCYLETGEVWGMTEDLAWNRRAKEAG